MKIISHDKYEVDIGPHVFPTAKYRLTRERLESSGAILASDIVRPEPATDAEIALVHTETWMRKLLDGRLTVREAATLEVPYSRALRESAWLCAGGSILTGRAALTDGVAVHLGGGFHHAFADHGEGFCPINDVAVAIRVLESSGEIERATVVDCDVHQGNGTAAIFADEPRVFTFSMHQQNNYPALKPPSDLDLGLSDGTGDAEYLGLLREHLPPILREHRPDLLYYLAGADPYIEDQLGGLGLSIDGLRERDQAVFEAARKQGIPVAVVLAGGYAKDSEDTVAIHANTTMVAMGRGA